MQRPEEVETGEALPDRRPVRAWRHPGRVGRSLSARTAPRGELRRGLYLATFEWISQRISEHLDKVGDDFTPDADGLFRMIDQYLQLCLEQPELPKLWFRRWMEDASDVTGLEEEVGAPAQETALAFFRRAIEPDLDPEAAMWTLVWAVHAYMLSGYPDASSRRRPPDDPESLHRFRRHLRRLTGFMVAS